ELHSKWKSCFWKTIAQKKRCLLFTSQRCNAIQKVAVFAELNLSVLDSLTVNAMKRISSVWRYRRLTQETAATSMSCLIKEKTLSGNRTTKSVKYGRIEFSPFRCSQDPLRHLPCSGSFYILHTAKGAKSVLGLSVKASEEAFLCMHLSVVNLRATR
ncbi:hypothetical protein J0S82_020577, partial [Galemys pyrenaicus]